MGGWVRIGLLHGRQDTTPSEVRPVQPHCGPGYLGFPDLVAYLFASPEATCFPARRRQRLFPPSSPVYHFGFPRRPGAWQPPLSELGLVDEPPPEVCIEDAGGGGGTVSWDP